jgi:hypothetical protein
MAIRARIPKPTSATAATSGRETPLVSGRVGDTLAEVFADGLAAGGLADWLADGLADGLADAVADGLAEGVVISPPPDTVTLAVISGWIVH